METSFAFLASALVSVIIVALVRIAELDLFATETNADAYSRDMFSLHD